MRVSDRRSRARRECRSGSARQTTGAPLRRAARQLLESSAFTVPPANVAGRQTAAKFVEYTKPSVYAKTSVTDELPRGAPGGHSAKESSLQSALNRCPPGYSLSNRHHNIREFRQYETAAGDGTSSRDWRHPAYCRCSECGSGLYRSRWPDASRWRPPSVRTSTARRSGLPRR